jgi:hypothetical protein
VSAPCLRLAYPGGVTFPSGYKKESGSSPGSSAQTLIMTCLVLCRTLESQTTRPGFEPGQREPKSPRGSP